MKTRYAKLWALALAAAGLLGTAHFAQADDGIFGSDIGLKINGGPNTFYEMSLLGDPRHAPENQGAVVLNTAGFNGLNLGTFNISTDSLLVIGGEVLTFKNGGSDVTSATIAYSIDGGAFQFLNLGFDKDAVGGNAGDQRWASVSATVNVLSGLSNGAHTLSAYTFAATNDNGNVFDSRGGLNYNATFTVVPEPSTWAMVVGGLGILIGVQRRRRRLS